LPFASQLYAKTETLAMGFMARTTGLFQPPDTIKPSAKNLKDESQIVLELEK